MSEMALIGCEVKDLQHVACATSCGETESENVKTKSVASQVDLSDSDADSDTDIRGSAESDAEDEFSDEDFQTGPCVESDLEEDRRNSGNLSGGSYDSDEFAQCHNFALENEELKKCLGTLHRGKKSKYKTSTSCWSRSTASASAAYKVFKIKRWHLTDVNLIFDPLIRSRSTIQVETNTLLWPPDKLPGNMIAVKALSVDGLLSGMGDRLVRTENLKKLDEVLKDIDGKITPELTSENTIDNVLGRLILKGTMTLPPAVIAPFHRFMFSLLRAMVNSEKNQKVAELTFQNVFETLFSCIITCINEEKRIDCRLTMDGIALDKLELAVFLKNSVQNLSVSSIPDLFIYERTQHTTSKRAIAVVEVKGKHGNHVVHSDDEEESEKTPTSLGVIEEESEEELPLVERIIKRKHQRMKRLKPQTRKYVKSFLPQLIGEMLCCNETTSVLRIKKREPGYSFGVAVVGFDVYFVTLATSNQVEGVKMTFTRSDLYTNVFITRPFNICVKKDRRIIFKVLAAACYVEDPIAFAYRESDIVNGLDLARLKIG